MKRLGPPKKIKQIVRRVVGEDPSLTAAANLLLYQRDPLFGTRILELSF